MFWDHDAKWCVHEVGGTKIDFRFSILQPHTGFHHFTEGISSLKQVTGRDHRDVQRYIVGVIAGAVPWDFLIAIRLAMDFQYCCQATELDDEDCDNALAALLEFHQHKSAIMDAAARVGREVNQLSTGIFRNSSCCKVLFLTFEPTVPRFSSQPISQNTPTLQK